MATRNSRRRRRVLATSNRLLRRHELLIERDTRRVFDKYGKEVVEASELVNSAKAKLSSIRDPLIRDLAAVFRLRLGQIVRIFGERVVESLRDAGFLDSQKSRESLEVKGFEEAFDRAIRLYIQEQSFLKATTISDTYIEESRTILQRAFDEGLGTDRIADILQERFNHLSRTQATRIARTETNAAANHGSQVAAEALDTEMVKEWGATDDPRTRPTHVAADGQRVALDEKFQVGSTQLLHPGDPNGPPSEIINCRCTVLYYPVVDGEVID